MVLFRQLLLIAGLMLTHAGLHASPDLPAVIFQSGSPTRLAWNTTVRVESDVLQLALSDSLLLSATKGAAFLLDPTDDLGIRVHIGAGNMYLVDIALQQVISLHPCTLLVSPPASNQAMANASIQGRGWLNPEDVHQQGFHFDDYAMLRQRELINRFTIDSATTANFLSGIAHSLSGRH